MFSRLQRKDYRNEDVGAARGTVFQEHIRARAVVKTGDFVREKSGGGAGGGGATVE